MLLHVITIEGEGEKYDTHDADLLFKQLNCVPDTPASLQVRLRGALLHKLLWDL